LSQLGNTEKAKNYQGFLRREKVNMVKVIFFLEFARAIVARGYSYDWMLSSRQLFSLAEWLFTFEM
jgi:hypothetical protein